MKHMIAALAVCVCAAPGLAAQSAEMQAKTETKIEVKEGKEVTVTGCVAAHPGHSGYALSNVAEKERQLGNYILVGDTDDLRDHLGQLVEVKGRVADQEKGKVEVKTKTEIEREDAEDTKTESKTELKGDLQGLPYLAVKDVKMLRPTCN